MKTPKPKGLARWYWRCRQVSQKYVIRWLGLGKPPSPAQRAILDEYATTLKNWPYAAHKVVTEKHAEAALAEAQKAMQQSWELADFRQKELTIQQMEQKAGFTPDEQQTLREVLQEKRQARPSSSQQKPKAEQQQQHAKQTMR